MIRKGLGLNPKSVHLSIKAQLFLRHQNCPVHRLSLLTRTQTILMMRKGLGLNRKSVYYVVKRSSSSTRMLLSNVQELRMLLLVNFLKGFQLCVGSCIHF